MKITFEMSGGVAYVPALNRAVTIDTEQIDRQTADQLHSLLQASHYFDQPTRANTPMPGAADYRTYTITVDDGLRTHTVQLTDPIGDANLSQLVSTLQSLARPKKP
jgi:hypothetical protein